MPETDPVRPSLTPVRDRWQITRRRPGRWRHSPVGFERQQDADRRRIEDAGGRRTSPGAEQSEEAATREMEIRNDQAVENAAAKTAAFFPHRSRAKWVGALL